MPAIYCKTCGLIIGSFYSLLDDNKIFTDAKENHKDFCNGRPNGIQKEDNVPIVDIMSYELWNRQVNKGFKTYEEYVTFMGGNKNMATNYIIEPDTKDEGWTWLINSKKWHYFVNNASLCKKWLLPFGGGVFEKGNNSKICSRLAIKRLEKLNNETSSRG